MELVMSEIYRHLDLFSGIGGFALAARWAGIETVGFCEIDDGCRRVLNRHWPNVKKHRDIRELNGNEYKGINIITGGYPCQPFSVAGNQKAEKDDRHIWPEMLRVITQAQPDWVICENVYGHIRLGLDGVLHDLEAAGYTTQSFVVPALCTGSTHNRQRVFIVAHTASDGQHESAIARSDEPTHGRPSERSEEGGYDERRGGLWFGLDWKGSEIGRGRTEPPEVRVDDELPGRMDRNRMIGNAIDPMIAYQIMKCIVQ